MTSTLHETLRLSSVHPWLKRNEAELPSCPSVISYTHDTGSGPVLILIHGYPQSAFLWRHVAALLKDEISLFIAEIPGYGISSPPKDEASFSTMGTPIIEACLRLFPGRDVIFGGHDRGARICHRLAVQNAHSASAPRVKLLGCILLDIVPTLEGWRGFADPHASVNYFHWPLLASPLGPSMIKAFGGAHWAHAALDRIAGGNVEARAKFQSDKAWELYESLFGTDEAIEGSCADYKAAAFLEPLLQTRDQKDGRKIQVPTLVGWSRRGLGSMNGDVGEHWKDWVGPQVSLTSEAFGDEVGHYLPEEAPGKVAQIISRFIKDL